MIDEKGLIEVRELLDVKDQKKLLVIEKIFYAENHSCAQEILLEELKITYPTLMTTIEKINEDLTDFGYPNFSIIHSPSNQLFSFDLKEDISMQIIVSMYLKASIKFEILEALLHRSYPTMKDLANKLNVSYLSIRTNIKKLNELLEGNKIVISTKKELSIQGNELSIRLYYTFILLFVYGAEKWPFSFIGYFEISNLLVHCPKEIYLAKTFDKSLLVHYYVAIHLLRDKKGNQLNREDMMKIPLYQAYSIESKKESQSFFQEMHNHMANVSIAYLTFSAQVLFSCILAFGGYSVIKNPPMFFYKDQQIKEIGFLDTIFFIMERIEQYLTTPLSKQEKDKLLYSLMSVNYRVHLFEDLKLDLELLIPEYRKIERHPAKKYKLDYVITLINEVISSNKNLLSNPFQEYLKYQYLQIIDKRIDFSKHTQKIKIATLSIISNEILTQELYAHFSQFYNIEVVEQLEANIDLFVSEFKLSQEVIQSLKVNQPVVYVHSRLVDSDYDKINKCLEEIAITKFKNQNNYQ